MLRTRLAALVLAALTLAVPVMAGDKDKDKKKPAAGAPVSTADAVRDAEQKAAAGDVDGAIQALRTPSQAADGGAAALLLGRLLERKGELDNAVDAYKLASGTLTGDAKGEALARLSLTQEVRGLPGSEASAEAALAAAPGSAWALVAASHARAHQGKADEALDLAEKAKAAGGGAAAQVALGHAYDAKGDLPAAETALRAAIDDPEQKAVARLGLARVLRRQGRAAEAEPFLNEAVAALPGTIEGYTEGALLKLALGRMADAMSDATLAAAMSENEPGVLRVRDEVAVAKAASDAARGEGEYAIRELERLQGESPKSGLLHVGVGRVRIAQRQADPALAAFAKAIELEPDLAAAQYWAGYTHHMLKRDAAAALPYYEKAVAAEPGNAEYRKQLGGVLVALNQPDKAVAELTKVTSSPGYANADAFMYLGAAQLALKHYADAVGVLGKAAELAPDNAQIETFLAWAYFGQKDSKNFVAHATRAKAAGQKDPKLLDYLARVEKGEAIK